VWEQQRSFLDTINAKLRLLDSDFRVRVDFVLPLVPLLAAEVAELFPSSSPL
jgi:hypothetical protein